MESPGRKTLSCSGRTMAFWGFAVHSFNASRAIAFLPVLGAERLTFASRLCGRTASPSLCMRAHRTWRTCGGSKIQSGAV